MEPVCDKELILVVCDTVLDTDRLMKATRILVKDSEFIKMDKASKTIETNSYIFRFVSKYDLDNGRLNGVRPSLWLTKNEMIELLEEGLNNE